MLADYNYGTKNLHGLKWGIYRFTNSNLQNNGWCVMTTAMGGDCERLPNQDLSRVSKDDRLIVMGNIWVHKDPHEQTLFRHPDEINKTGATWFYWDNPQLPHLLYKGPWNPRGYKNWLRLVPGNTATQSGVGPRRKSNGKLCAAGPQRINGQIATVTERQCLSWHDIVGPRKPMGVKTKTALLCPSGAGIFPHYYGINKADWIREKTTYLESQGWRVILRDKPSRRGREECDNGRLYEQLHAENIGITVSIHSVTPVESLIAGVPAIVEGRHAGGDIATPWSEFESTGNIRTPHETEVDAWVDRLCYDTYHKSEIYDGMWYKGAP